MDGKKQQQTVAINRGLFLVRYAAAEDKSCPPKVEVAPDADSNNDLAFLLHPDHDAAVLWQPDSCLAVRAVAPGKIRVQVVPAHEGGSVAATVRIEPLNQGIAVPSSGQTTNRSNAAYDFGNFRVLGHLNGIGDVSVNANEWLGGPSEPLRIEGISIDWPGKPADLNIHYAVKTAKPQTVSGQKVDLGSFAGTRGKAMPLVGLVLELSGPAAPHFQITVETIFLGSPVTRITGRRVVASGPTGREPLVGLRIGLETGADAVQPKAKTSVTKSERSAGRVRVFRSRQNQREPAIV